MPIILLKKGLTAHTLLFQIPSHSLTRSAPRSMLECRGRLQHKDITNRKTDRTSEKLCHNSVKTSPPTPLNNGHSSISEGPYQSLENYRFRISRKELYTCTHAQTSHLCINPGLRRMMMRGRRRSKSVWVCWGENSLLSNPDEWVRWNELKVWESWLSSLNMQWYDYYDAFPPVCITLLWLLCFICLPQWI